MQEVINHVITGVNHVVAVAIDLSVPKHYQYSNVNDTFLWYLGGFVVLGLIVAFLLNKE